MFKELKMKIAARRVERKKARAAAKKSRNTKSAKHTANSRAARIREILCAPFRAIGRAAKRAWEWIRCIDLIGLVNLTLLVAIIVLFSMLIIDIVKSRRTPMVVIARNDIAAEQTVTQDRPQKIRTVKARPTKIATVPVKIDAHTRKYVSEPVNVVPVKKYDVAVAQTARISNTMYGDVIIDSRGAAKMLKNGDKIKGNLYLQNMRKYTLPCNMRIEGNLFLRDVNMLQFCGDFTVTGNIYVSPRSSFGPIPRTARLGGQVIL